MSNQRMVGFRVNDDTYQKIVALSKKNGVSISSLLRHACEIGLDEKQRKRDAVLIETLIILRSAISSKDKELAEFVEKETRLNLQNLYK